MTAQQISLWDILNENVACAKVEEIIKKSQRLTKKFILK